MGDYRFRGVPFSAWLFRIASNEVSQYYRQVQKNRVVSIDESEAGEMIDQMVELNTEQYRNSLIIALDNLKEIDFYIH